MKIFIKKKRGFTLVELILVITISVVVFAATFVVQNRFLVDTYLDTHTEDVLQTLRLAQMRSITRYKDDTWGVYFNEDPGGINDHFVLFKGASYASRDTDFDVITDLPDAISLSEITFTGGGNDMVFSKLTGETNTFGTLKISDNLDGDHTISVNNLGLIQADAIDGGGEVDETAPSDITDLAASNATTSSIDLAWTAPGDDGSVGTATSYDVRYSTSTITELNWASATEATGEPTPSAAGSSESMTVSGLTADTTYYFAIKSSDEAPNESDISNAPSLATLAGNNDPPSTITNLATSNATTNSIDLSWTAPSDDGVSGAATSYDVRHSTSTITEGNWSVATEATGEPTPSAAGSSESMTVSGLGPDTTYYFAIKSSDEVPNESNISNVPSSSTLPSNTFRITEYMLSSGTFTGNSYDLTLDQDLKSNYFVIVQGSDGDGSSNNTRGPDENYARLIADPVGTGDLSTSGGANILSFARESFVNSWVGVITVVECLGDCAASGFSLLGVENVNHSGSNESGIDTSSVAWTDIDQIMLMGGFSGPGCTTTSTSAGAHKACQARLWPSATNVINWERDVTGGSLTTAISTVMVIEWGSEWTVQHVNAAGSSGGDGANATGEYDTAVINSVARANTWVWGTGWTNDGGIGDGAEATLITLGDGVNQNTNETTVAVGQEYSDTRSFDVYVLTHPNAAVDYRFKSDGQSSSLTYDVTVDTSVSDAARMALVTNGCNGTGSAFPRPIFSARYLDDSTVRLERRRSGQNFPAWVQAIDLSNIQP